MQRRSIACAAASAILPAIVLALPACTQFPPQLGGAIEATPPIITIDSPKEGEELPYGEIEICGTIAAAPGSWVQVDGVPAWMRAGEFYACLPAPLPGTHGVEVSAYDVSGERVCGLEWTVWVDDSAPEVVLLGPKDGAVVIDEEVLVRGTVTDRSGVNFVFVNGVPAQVSGSKWWILLPVPPGRFAFTVRAADVAGNLSEPQVYTRLLVHAPKPLDSEQVTIVCQIVKISEENPNLFIFSAGSEDGVAEGDELDIERQGEFVGKAKVERVSEDLGAAIIVFESLRPKHGDHVRIKSRSSAKEFVLPK
ncbi:MAG: hypothetical protein L0Z55_09355 [Planctomycetes bacterium]|nr:hypothetical protein [Planctomycetota bacterium]